MSSIEQDGFRAKAAYDYRSVAVSEDVCSAHGCNQSSTKKATNERPDKMSKLLDDLVFAEASQSARMSTETRMLMNVLG